MNGVMLRFGWLRNSTTVSPDYFMFPPPEKSGEKISVGFLVWHNAPDYGDGSGLCTGFTFALVCQASATYS